MNEQGQQQQRNMIIQNNYKFHLQNFYLDINKT